MEQNPGLRLSAVDPAIAETIAKERQRQQENIELIASENFTSPAVMEAQGSVLTNKYAEGYPGKRYYGGCEHVDVAERLAQERALALFPGAEQLGPRFYAGTGLLLGLVAWNAWRKGRPGPAQREVGASA